MVIHVIRVRHYPFLDSLDKYEEISDTVLLSNAWYRVERDGEKKKKGSCRLRFAMPSTRNGTSTLHAPVLSAPSLLLAVITHLTILKSPHTHTHAQIYRASQPTHIQPLSPPVRYPFPTVVNPSRLCPCMPTHRLKTTCRARRTPHRISTFA